MSRFSQLEASDTYRAFMQGYLAGKLAAQARGARITSVCDDFVAGYEQGYQVGKLERRESIGQGDRLAVVYTHEKEKET